MEITGKVHEIGQTQEVTESFKKRELIIEYAENPQYPEFIKLEATQDRVSIFDNLTIGDEVTVSFNLRGRPWTNKEGVTIYFNTLVAWRINVNSKSNTASAPTPMPSPDNNEDDGLPF